MAILFSINVAGAFDTVSHHKLLHNLQKKRIPAWIANWVNNFLFDRNTTLALNNKTSESFVVFTGIFQKSPISFILYLFYNADLLDICERPGISTNAINFINDVNILAYGTLTKGNVETLEWLHKKCES